VYAQHTKYDISASFAYSGQDPFITSGSTRFFSKPTIWDLKYQLATTFVQSISLVLEHIGEVRSRQGIWYPAGDPVDPNSAYNALISESLSMTSLYLEMARTVFRTDIFRIAVGADLGYGLGSTGADVDRQSDHTRTHYDGNSPWSSFFLGAFIRARLTIVDNNNLDIGLTVTGRYWGMPTLGPISASPGTYNGPNVTNVHELGYLAGISVGLKK
jgi:hypothetical protein